MKLRNLASRKLPTSSLSNYQLLFSPQKCQKCRLPGEATSSTPSSWTCRTHSTASLSAKLHSSSLASPEVEVEVEDRNILRISGARTRENEENTDTWHRAERSSSKFLRRFRHPENAKMENEVLIGTVPKEEVKKPSGKSIVMSLVK